MKRQGGRLPGARAGAAIARLCLAFALTAVAAAGAIADSRVQTLPLSVTRIEADGAVVAADGAWHRPDVIEGRLVITPAEARPAVEPVEPEQLPHSRPASGRQHTGLAWLARPTARYRHGVLGDALEAEALRYFRSGFGTTEIVLPPDAVFEDLEPRLADLDGDGQEEILVVRSTFDHGAALVAYGIVGDALVEKAAATPIGTPNRWLNPVGVADLDGDGQPEIMAVDTPHIGGTLRVWRLESGRLSEFAALSGFSNHVIGSTELALHAVLDWDLDGRPDIVLPDVSRTALRIISLKQGKLVQVDHLPLPGPLNTRIAAATGGLVLGTQNGFLVRLRRH